MSTINESIFKAYDIRALYPQEVNEEAAYRIGRAMVQIMQAKKVAVGRDMRQSSPALQEALIKGLTQQGADVITLGLVTTPLVYFASSKLEVDAAVMVTASHNPAEYNGIKICKKNAVMVGLGLGMDEIKELAIKGEFEPNEKIGQVTENEDIKQRYFDYLASFFKTGKEKKKIVIDFGNGMGSIDKAVYERFKDDLDITYMFEELDGNFPNHEANPMKAETLEALQKEVVKQKADLGIAYDGDADRVGFVDEKGQVVPMDFIIALISREILKANPGSLILVDLRSSKAVREFIEELGGRVELCPVGNPIIKNLMNQKNAVFGGELSGHYFFGENNQAEFTTLAAIMIINLINETGKTMSELTSELQRYYRPGEINSEVQDKEAVFEKLKAKYADGELSLMDGVRVDYPNWWFSVRASNTEPKMRLNLEADTSELMQEKQAELLNVIRG